MKFGKLLSLLAINLFMINLAIIAQEENEEESRYLRPLPIIQKYEGIGLFYGGAIAAKWNEYEAQLGFVTGDLVAVGTRLGYVAHKLKLYLNYGKIREITPRTYYSRGTNSSAAYYNDIFYQRAHADAKSISLGFSMFNLDIKFGMSQFDSEIEHFLDSDKKEIETPEIHITPFEQTTYEITLGKNIVFSGAGKSEKGMDLSLQYISKSKSPGYAAHDFATIDTRVYRGFSPGSIFEFNLFYSTVVNVERKLDTFDSVKNAFSIDCSQAKPDNEEICSVFENAVASYVSNHNHYGTARHLGGSEYLPAYAQSRFRAANSAYLGFNYDYFVSDKVYIPDLQFSIETGFAADDKAKLFSNSKNSLGIGAIWKLRNNTNLRFMVANGGDGTALTFTLKK